MAATRSPRDLAGRLSEALAGTDPITSNLYDSTQVDGVPEKALEGCGIDMLLSGPVWRPRRPPLRSGHD